LQVPLAKNSRALAENFDFHRCSQVQSTGCFQVVSNGLVWINHNNLRGIDMPFWQRLLILLVAVMAVSFIVGLIWHAMWGYYLPSYISGLVGGLSAVWIWDILKKTKPK
jgi:hypothetical protein